MAKPQPANDNYTDDTSESILEKLDDCWICLRALVGDILGRQPTLGSNSGITLTPREQQILSDLNYAKKDVIGNLVHK